MPRDPLLSRDPLPRDPLLSRDPLPRDPLLSRDPLLYRDPLSRDPSSLRDSLLDADLTVLELRERERAVAAARQRLRKERLLLLLERELEEMDATRARRPLARDEMLFNEARMRPSFPPAPPPDRVMLPTSRGPLLRAPSPGPPLLRHPGARGRGFGRGRGALLRPPVPARTPQAAPTIDDWLFDDSGRTSLESVTVQGREMPSVRPSVRARGRGFARGAANTSKATSSGMGEWQPVVNAESASKKMVERNVAPVRRDVVETTASHSEKSKGPSCPFQSITGCEMRPFKIRHLARKHLPQQLFRCAPTETQEERCSRVLEFLSDLCKHLDVSSLDDLLTSFTERGEFVATEFKVGDAQRELCAHLHKHLQLPLSFDDVDFHKPNCVSALAWFQNIVILCRRLKPNCMNQLSAKYASDSSASENKEQTGNTEKPKKTEEQAQDTQPPVEETPVVEPAAAPAQAPVNSDDVTVPKESENSKPAEASESEPPVDVLQGVSALCHLDELVSSKSGSNFDVDRLLAQSNSRQLRALIGSFSLPSLYPSKVLLEHIASDKRMFLAIGYCASNVRKTTEAQRVAEQVASIADRCPKLVALGRVGLDFRRADEELRLRQISVLLHLCRVARERSLPLVVECVESSEPAEKCEATQTAIAVLRKVLPSNYPVFKTNVQLLTEAVLWSDAFPRCVFGVNESVCGGKPDQEGVFGVVNIFPQRILIESQASPPSDDAPADSTPVTSYFAVAQRVAELTSKSLASVVSISSSNASRFFDIQ